MIHDMPAVLIECGFQTNNKDKECLYNPTYQNELMQAVTNGVVNYFNSMPVNSGARTTAGVRTSDAAGRSPRLTPRGSLIHTNRPFISDNRKINQPDGMPLSG